MPGSMAVLTVCPNRDCPASRGPENHVSMAKILIYLLGFCVILNLATLFFVTGLSPQEGGATAGGDEGAGGTSGRVDSQVESIRTMVKGMQAKVDRLVTKVGSLETRFSGLQREVGRLPAAVATATRRAASAAMAIPSAPPPETGGEEVVEEEIVEEEIVEDGVVDEPIEDDGFQPEEPGDGG